MISSSGHSDLALWLMEKGCNVERIDVNGKTAFEEAVVRDQVQVRHKTQVGDNIIGKKDLMGETICK